MENKRACGFWHRFLWSGALILAFVPLAGCKKNADEEAIHNIIGHVRVHFEEKDFAAGLEPVTEDYSDNARNRRKTLQPRLNRIFRAYERLEIRVNIEKLEIKGISAQVMAKVKVNGFDDGQKIRLFGSPIRAQDLQIDFEKRKDRWWIVGSALIRRKSII